MGYIIKKMEDKITFKVIHLSNSSQPRQIELKNVSRDGQMSWIDSSGAETSAPPPLGVLPEKLNLTSSEKYEAIEGGQKVKKARAFGIFSYVSEDKERSIEDTYERARNRVLRQAHLMLKTHQACVYRDEKGNDINPNRWGASVMFELIEESQNVKNKNAFNDKITEAMNKAKALFEGSHEAFVDFCYAYGITKVNITPPEILYNDICQRIIVNPDHFLKTHDAKDNQMLILLRKGLEEMKDDNSTLIGLENGLYVMNGEILGDTEEKVVYHLSTHPKLKEYLMLALGITPDVIVDVVNLSPVSDHPVKSEAKKLMEKGMDQAAVSEMKTKLNFMFNKAKGAISKDPSKKGEVIVELEQKIEENRSKYATLLPYYDEHVSKCRSNSF